MQGLILAAGRGSRLNGHGKGRPKCLVEVGGRPLIEHQLDALSSAGIDSVTMVVGYQHEQIRKIVGSSVRYVLNDKYAETNSLYSFLLAREDVTSDLIVLNSDVLFDPAILQILKVQEGSALAFDSSSGDDPEHMKVQIDDGQLVRMAKDLPAAFTAGENVGIIWLDAEAAENTFDFAAALAASGRSKQWLASAINRTAQRHRIHCVDVAEIPWIEIDFPEDLDLAREMWSRDFLTSPAERVEDKRLPRLDPVHQYG